MPTSLQTQTRCPVGSGPRFGPLVAPHHETLPSIQTTRPRRRSASPRRGVLWCLVTSPPPIPSSSSPDQPRVHGLTPESAAAESELVLTGSTAAGDHGSKPCSHGARGHPLVCRERKRERGAVHRLRPTCAAGAIPLTLKTVTVSAPARANRCLRPTRAERERDRERGFHF